LVSGRPSFASPAAERRAADLGERRLLERFEPRKERLHLRRDLDHRLDAVRAREPAAHLAQVGAGAEGLLRAAQVQHLPVAARSERVEGRAELGQPGRAQGVHGRPVQGEPRDPAGDLESQPLQPY
jgi:hypothetical protein